MFRIDLRRLILLLSISVVTLTAGNIFYASYETQRHFLMQQTLEANRIYAVKLASTTDNFIASAQQQLAFGANLMPAIWNQTAALNREAYRLRQQSNSFNSIVVARADGTIIAASPRALNLLGSVAESAGPRDALRLRQPFISKPYIGLSKHLMIHISQPVFGENGDYLGLVAGSIYLNEPNILHSLLGEHYYRDGSYLFVVDPAGKLIYHQDPERVGQIIQGNPAIDAVIAGHVGSQRLKNSQGVDMLAGYAPVARTGWGVISQRPTAVTLEGLQQLMRQVFGYALPFLVLSLLGIWWISSLITRPLSQLANSAQYWGSLTAAESIGKVRAWYYEAAQLKQAMQKGLALLHQQLGKLNRETVTDPLTGLTNRRGMQLTLDQWEAGAQPFSVITLDVDHFKQVNDTHGHSAGDLVLQHLAQQLRQHSRDSDVLCRLGGEEFVMLLPQTPLEQAVLVAERLRLAMSAEQPSSSIQVTVSLGVAHWPMDGLSVEALLKEADKALYRAKHGGRNRVVAVQPQARAQD